MRPPARCRFPAVFTCTVSVTALPRFARSPIGALLLFCGVAMTVAVKRYEILHLAGCAAMLPACLQRSDIFGVQMRRGSSIEFPPFLFRRIRRSFSIGRIENCGHA